ncbi:MAG: hypothetical protein EBQ78_12215 [Betaproteobacteria bacterium]|nr:hypothetical protein [Betaproteobacteria bacterium]
MIVPHDRVVRVAPELGPEAVLLALAATCYHTISLGGAREPMIAPIDCWHGVMGRLLAESRWPRSSSADCLGNAICPTRGRDRLQGC